MTATAGRSSRSSSASPGSAEPWCATFRISIAPRQQPRRHVGLGVGGQQRVDLAVASRAGRSGAGSDPRSPFPACPARGRGAGGGRAGSRRRRASRRPARRDPPPRRARRARTGLRRRAADRGRDRPPAASGLSSAPPMWSRCGCVSTSAASRRTPSPRSWRATSASGGPWSTSTAPSGTWSRIASPWPTSRNVIRRPGRRRQARLREELPGEQRRQRRRDARDRQRPPPPRQALEERAARPASRAAGRPRWRIRPARTAARRSARAQAAM